MRLRRSRQKTLYLYNRTVGRDAEGGTQENFPASGTAISGEWWTASGKLQADLYGQRLPYIRNIRLSERYEAKTDAKGRTYYYLPDRDTELREADRIGIETDLPQYRILSIRAEHFLRLEAEAVVQ